MKTLGHQTECLHEDMRKGDIKINQSSFDYNEIIACFGGFVNSFFIQNKQKLFFYQLIDGSNEQEQRRTYNIYQKKIRARNVLFPF